MVKKLAQESEHGEFDRARRMADEAGVERVEWRAQTDSESVECCEARILAQTALRGTTTWQTQERMQAWTDGSWKQRTRIGGWAIVLASRRAETVIAGAGVCENSDVTEVNAILLAIGSKTQRRGLTILTDTRSLTGEDAGRPHEPAGIKARARIEKAITGRDIDIQWRRRNSSDQAKAAHAHANLARKKEEHNAREPTR